MALIEVNSPVAIEPIQIDRIIARLYGKKRGPCIIFFAGIHGNEPSGVFAFQKVLQSLEKEEIQINGSIIGISGNLWALQRSKRFHTTDLNRLWTKEQVAALQGITEPESEDQRQQLEIYDTLQSIIRHESGPFYFFDLHTTSSDTVPFITVNDSLLNRRFTRQYPVPLVLGIEEYLDGPLLSYINELGYVSFGFEGGQHDDPNAVANHVAFIYLSLVFSGVLEPGDLPYHQYYEHLSQQSLSLRSFFEIYDRHQIMPDDRFVMKPGFTNFQRVSKGDQLASSNGQTLTAKTNTMLFMPLYQSQGDDGYFLIRPIPRFFLWLSAALRKCKLDRIFPLLPGVYWLSEEKDLMQVDLRIARFVARKIFHLFGYRSKQYDTNHLIIANREARSRTPDYKDQEWFKGRFLKSNK